MRLLLLPFLLLLCSVPATAQRNSEWTRVYTFDDSIVEMNTVLITRISEDVTRVRFRWTFDELQPLRGETGFKYKTRLEVMEFNCAVRNYRPYHITFFDGDGNVIRINDSPGTWRGVDFGQMTEKLLVSACKLITRKPTAEPSEEFALQKVSKFAQAFSSDLERAKDFKPIIEKFFASEYLNTYLRENNLNWLPSLSPQAAASASRAELERFYVALMNAYYLTSVYLISQVSSEPVDAAAYEKLLPADVMQTIRDHPHTRSYQTKISSNGHFSDQIDSAQRLQTYTDLLERVAVMMRKHVTIKQSTQSEQYRATLLEWQMYQPKVRICNDLCLGLARGTRIFEVDVPVFRLQVAEVKGQLKIISARSLF